MSAVGGVWQWAKDFLVNYQGVDEREMNKSCGAWERYWNQRHAGKCVGIEQASMVQATAFRDSRRGAVGDTNAALNTLEKVYQIAHAMMVSSAGNGSLRVPGAGVLRNPFDSRMLPRRPKSGKPKKPVGRLTPTLLVDVGDCIMDDPSLAGSRDLLLIYAIYNSDLSLAQIAKMTIAEVRLRPSWTTNPRVRDYLNSQPPFAPAFPRATRSGDIDVDAKGNSHAASERALYAILKGRGEEAGLTSFRPTDIRRLACQANRAGMQ